MGDEPDFADLLRRFRVAAGLTQGDLAARANLSERGVSDLERGLRRAPHRETVSRLADALELGASERSVLLAAGRRRAASNGLFVGAPTFWSDRLYSAPESRPRIDAAWASGRALPADQAIAEALKP